MGLSPYVMRDIFANNCITGLPATEPTNLLDKTDGSDPRRREALGG